MADPKDKPEKQESLPFPPTPSASIAGRTMQESVYKQRVTPRRLPADAPNILIVLIDDAGPGLPATFGGEVQTPTMDRIVKEGIAYNRFHTTAMCSPTRASLLTGRNHHRVGNGQIAELANDWDGYSGHDSQEQRLGGRGAQGLRLRHRRLGQVAQHAGRGDHCRRPVRELAHGPRLRVFLRLPRPARRRNTSRTWCATRPTSMPPKTRGGGLPPQRRPGGRRDRLAAQAQGLPAGQAVLHVLGERRDPRSASRREGVGGQVQGQVRRRLGRLPRARFRARQGEGLDSRRRSAHAAARNDAVLGQHPRGREALPAPPDGSGGRLHRTRGRPGRPGRRRDRQARLWRQYADLLHLGRQRLLGGRPGRHDQRTAGAKRHSHHHRVSTSRRSRSSAGSTCSARPRPTPCTMRDGPGPAARPTRARSSWPRISAARATRWPSAGRRRSSPMRPRGRSFTTSTTSSRRSTRSSASPRRAR